MRWLRTKWRISLLLGVAALLALVAWAGASGQRRSRQDETWARCQREGVLRVGMDASYPPFEVEEGGTLWGYDVDLAREIGRQLGLQVVFVNVSFDGLYDALAAGRCDILISALPYERQRTRDVLYTGGYFNAGQVLVVRGDNQDIRGHQDLAHRRVAVEMGSLAHQEALRLRDREHIALSIVPTQSGKQALDLVQAGEVEAAIADKVTARLGLREHLGLELRGAALTDESYVIAVRQDSPQLFAAVSSVLDSLRGEGWLETLTDRWL